MNSYHRCMYETYNPSPNPVPNHVHNPVTSRPHLIPIPTPLLHKNFNNMAYVCFLGSVYKAARQNTFCLAVSTRPDLSWQADSRTQR